MFSTLSIVDFSIWLVFIWSSANAFSLDKSKILLFGKHLSLYDVRWCNKSQDHEVDWSSGIWQIDFTFY